MSKKNRFVSASGLAALVACLLVNLQLSAAADDTKVEQAIQTMGGIVTRDTADGRPTVKVSLIATRVTLAQLKDLGAFQNLQSLDLRVTKVSDAWLRELVRFKSLQTLNLGLTSVTDAGLKDLARVQSLQNLYLNETKVTNAGVAELRKALPQCRIYR